METTKLRYTTFTTLLSISFLLPGLAARADATPLQVLSTRVTARQLVFLLGYVFYLVSVFHYIWYHRYAHRYRKALKEMEEQLGIAVYRLRVRPGIGPFKAHFVWVLYIIAIVYGFAILLVVGTQLFTISMAGIAALYLLFFLFSYLGPTEPLEEE